MASLKCSCSLQLLRQLSNLQRATIGVRRDDVDQLATLLDQHEDLAVELVGAVFVAAGAVVAQDALLRLWEGELRRTLQRAGGRAERGPPGRAGEPFR